MSDYTPTTEEVETHWVNVGFAGDRASFRRWLAKNDAEVAATERERIATAIAEEAETWEATADRLQLEKEYADANRYYNFAAARRNVAAMLRNGAYGPGTPEPSAAEYRKTTESEQSNE